MNHNILEQEGNLEITYVILTLKNGNITDV